MRKSKRDVTAHRKSAEDDFFFSKTTLAGQDRGEDREIVCKSPHRHARQTDRVVSVRAQLCPAEPSKIGYDARKARRKISDGGQIKSGIKWKTMSKKENRPGTLEVNVVFRVVDQKLLHWNGVH